MLNDPNIKLAEKGLDAKYHITHKKLMAKEVDTMQSWRDSVTKIAVALANKHGHSW